MAVKALRGPGLPLLSTGTIVGPSHAQPFEHRSPRPRRRISMARAYNVIDADGHVLEPVDIWDKYIDPTFRDRAPRIVIDTDGKERLLVESRVLGSQKGFGVIGA